MVKTNTEVDAHRGMSMFIVPADTPGIEIVRNVPVAGEVLPARGRHRR